MEASDVKLPFWLPGGSIVGDQQCPLLWVADSRSHEGDWHRPVLDTEGEQFAVPLYLVTLADF